MPRKNLNKTTNKNEAGQNLAPKTHQKTTTQTIGEVFVMRNCATRI